MEHLLYSPQQQDPRGGVAEWDDLSGSLVRDNFCTPTASYEVRTVAGLSMRFGLGRESKYERDWTFISNQRTVYRVWVNDEPLGYYGYRTKSENSAVVETFAPQYATWGCA
jgi:hypothetical protein